MAEIASAYVSLIPSAKGFGAATASQIGPQAAGAGKQAGGILGKAMLIGFAAAGVAAGVGKALYEIGQTFDDLSDTIIVGTGATGKVLAGLEASAEQIGKTTPSSFADIGIAVADLNTRLGLTGKPLESMASQMLNLSRITETDLSGNIADMTRVFGDWGIKMRDQPAALDAIFKASQLTGTGINDLAQSVVRMGAPLRQFGFSFEESLAMFGKWEKEGVNTTAVMSGLKIGLGKFSKAGLAPKKALEDVQKAIMGAGSAGEANKIAIEAFGQRAGPDMAAAVREGRFELGSLVKSLDESNGSIAHADLRTRDFAETWQIFKNQVLLKIKPVAEAVFAGFTDFAVMALPKVISGFKAVSEAVAPFIAQVKGFMQGSGGAGLADFFQNRLLPALSALAGFIRTKVVPAFRDYLTRVIAGARDAFESIREAVKRNEPQLRQLLTGFKKVAEFIITKVVPVIGTLVGFLIKNLGRAIAGAIDFIGRMVSQFNTVKDVITSVITKAKAFKTGIEVAAKGAYAAISRWINVALGPIRNLIDALQTAINKFNELRGKSAGGVKGAPQTMNDAGRLSGRSFGEGFARGIESTTEKVSQATQNMIDKLKSKLDGLKSDFASLASSVAGAFTGNLFESETAGGFISNLLDTKGQLTALKAAFTKLIGWGLKPEFLSQLFQSGNGGLILDLAAGTQAQASQANALFGDVTTLSNQLGANVADAKFGDKIDGVRSEIKELRGDVKRLARDIGAEVGGAVNGAARGGRRRARAA